jgi:hypothetical protein
VKSIHLKCVPDSVAEKWQIQIVCRAKDNGVHFLDTSVCEPDRLPVHLKRPGLGLDTTRGYEWQEVLALRDAGIEDVIGRFKCAELLWANTRLGDEILDLRTSLAASCSGFGLF